MCLLMIGTRAARGQRWATAGPMGPSRYGPYKARLYTDNLGEPDQRSGGMRVNSIENDLSRAVMEVFESR